MNIVVIGGGAWGTALAILASHSHHTTLAVRSASAKHELDTQRENVAYLPGFALPMALRIAHVPSAGQFPQELLAADLVILATPAAAVESWLAALPPMPALAWLSKGLVFSANDDPHALLLHEVAARVCPNQPVGVLSGPSFAQEVARGRLCAVVAASEHADVRARLIGAFHSERFRVYGNDDIGGVEVGGAVKNVLAIAAGVCDGLGLGLNARAALLTRGLAEMSRFGVALGARLETFMGLSGLGDLVLTATGDLSRNRRVGLALAQGQTVDQIVATLGHVAEGVPSAKAIARRAASLGVEMPMVDAVNRLILGQVTPEQAVSELMGRNPADE